MMISNRATLVFQFVDNNDELVFTVENEDQTIIGTLSIDPETGTVTPNWAEGVLDTPTP